MFVPSMGFTLMAAASSLPCAGSGRASRDFLPMPGPGNGCATDRKHEEAHKDAHGHHGEGIQREVGRRRLRHPDHTRFRVSLGLHDVLALADTNSILTRGIRPGNSNYPA